MKILILGHKRSGKDTAAEFWRDFYHMSFKSSSQMANDLFMFDKLKDAYAYTTKQECFDDRVNHRKEWYDAIVEYNGGQNRLTKKILTFSDCYVGMRDLNEFMNSRYLFDLVIWIDASDRVELESKESMNIPMEVADIVITNNTTLQDFEKKLKTVGKLIFK